MNTKAILVEHLSKQYDLGVIGTGTLTRDLNRWWAKLRGKPDPYTRIGERDHFEKVGESILALDDVSFTVNKGEALGIIGKNGAGKSTLLKILSRVTAPTSGVVKVKGRIGSLLEIGTGFHPELTGRENVYLNGTILGMRRDEVDRKFDEIVDFSGVEKFIDTPVKRYSSGMYVRLAFAVAAHLDPDILIVDEVLAVGDAEFQKKCLGKMNDVAGEGRTVLFVSHNMAAIQRLCDNCIYLKNGSINCKGRTEEIVQFYLNENLEDKNEYQIKTNRDDDFVITNIELFNKNMLENWSPISGDSLIVKIDFSARKFFENVRFCLTIYNHLEVACFHLSSESYDQRFNINVGEGYVLCSIENLPLPIGTYRISTAAKDYFGDLAHLKNGCIFDVKSSHFFSNFYTPSVKISTVLLEHKWEM